MTAFESQRLLVPVLIDLPGAGHATLLARADDLAAFGFEVEDFGGTTVRVAALPALLSADECERALRALQDAGVSLE